MSSRRRSEKRQRTEVVVVRLTPLEKALLNIVVEREGARGAGTVLRDTFMARWNFVHDEAQDVLRAVRDAEAARGIAEVMLPGRAAERASQERSAITEAEPGKQ